MTWFDDFSQVALFVELNDLNNIDSSLTIVSANSRRYSTMISNIMQDLLPNYNDHKTDQEPQGDTPRHIIIFCRSQMAIMKNQLTGTLVKITGIFFPLRLRQLIFKSYIQAHNIEYLDNNQRTNQSRKVSIDL